MCNKNLPTFDALSLLGHPTKKIDLGNSTAGLDKDAGSGANQTIQSLLHHQEWAALGGLVKVLERFRLQSAVDVRGYQALRIAASVVSMSAKESIVRDQSLQALL